jgi:hypothetical protein
MAATTHKSRAEPFINYFFREYSGHLADSSVAFDCITARTPFYMGLNLLRLARHDHITEAYGRRLVRQAKRLLAYPQPQRFRGGARLVTDRVAPVLVVVVVSGSRVSGG